MRKWLLVFVVVAPLAACKGKTEQEATTSPELPIASPSNSPSVAPRAQTAPTPKASAAGLGGGLPLAIPSGSPSFARLASSEDATGAARTLAEMRRDFKRCYQAELKTNPSAAGKVELTVSIGANGEVKDVRSATVGKLPKQVGTCIVDRVRRARFDPPDGGTATIVFPIVFTQG